MKSPELYSKYFIGAIEKDHPEYYIKLLALRKMIQIPGYKESTMAENVR